MGMSDLEDWEYGEADAVDEALEDLFDEWGDEDFEWGDEGFFRRLAQRVRSLGQRAGRWLIPRLAPWILSRDPDPRMIRRRPDPPPLIAPPPPRLPVPPPWLPVPSRLPPGTPTNGSPPLRWDPRWFPPIRRRRPDINFEAAEADALMQHLGHAAAEAETEDEAEAFVGAMIPLAARLAPAAAPALLRNAPALIRTAVAATRALRQSGTTRPLVRLLPTAVRRTAVSLARQTARGRMVTPAAASRTLAAQTTGLLQRPRRSLDALRRSVRVDSGYHEDHG